MRFIAHVDPDRKRKQSMIDHLTGTAELAASFAEIFGAGSLAYRCGMLGKTWTGLCVVCCRSPYGERGLKFDNSTILMAVFGSKLLTADTISLSKRNYGRRLTMRLFFAINFSDKTRVRLLDLGDQLRSRSKRGNFSLPENLHLTLAFLGECGTRQTAAAKTVMEAINFEPFPIRIERIGRFKRNSGDIWWAGTQVSKPLIDLQGDLTDKLIDAGFTLEKRKYSPHITLGREVVTDTVPWQIEPIDETVTSIELMKSERISGKLTYTSVQRKQV